MATRDVSVVTIREPIGYAWQREPVWLDLPRRGPAVVVDADTGVAVPSQTTGVYTPDGVEEPPRICALVDLAPDQTLRLEARSDTAAASADPGPFAVAAAPGEWIIGNGCIRVRIPQSGAFGPGSAPGPVLAMQRHGDARWSGSGTWGPTPCAGRIETTIIDRGPLFARWVTRYLGGGFEEAAYDVTLWAGEDFLHVRDRSLLDAGREFGFALAGSDAPAEWFIFGGGEQVQVVRGPLSAPPSPKGVTRPGELIHVDFHSGHHQMSYTWCGFLRPGAPAIGLSELNGGHWQIPGRNRIKVRRATDGVVLAFPANGGSKEFALVCGDAERYAPVTGLSQFCHLRRKYSDLPLEQVRRWVTDWEPKTRKRPILYPRGTAEKWERKFAAWPALADGFRRLLPLALEGKAPAAAYLPVYLVTGNAAVLENLYENIERDSRVGVEHAVENGYLRLIIFDGRAMKAHLEALDILRWRGELTPELERRFARRFAFLAYCFRDPNFWPWENTFRDRGDARGHGEEYWEDIGDIICPPNFSTEYFTSFALMGLAYPEHPTAPAWIADGIELFARQLDRNFYESGGYCESLNYHAHEAIMLNQLAVALAAAGHRDFLAHPRFKANFGFLTRMLTPPAALTESGRKLANVATLLNPAGSSGGAVLVTNWGNSGSDCSGYNLPQTVAVAAGIYASRDPEYARRLMTAWRRSTQEFCTWYSGFNLVAFGRPDLPDADPGLCSEEAEGLGINMRAEQGTDREVYAWVKSGLATHHNCRDEGGMVLYAYGAPVIGDFGYHTEHEGKREGGYETWKHTCVTFAGKDTCAYLGCERTVPPELWRSTPDADLLVAWLPVDYVIPDGHFYLEAEHCRPRIEHRRFIVFLKPDCFVIYDHIPASSRGSTWWVHALADSVEVTGAGVHFRGRYGVDLHVQVLLPAGPQIRTGVYAVQRHMRIDQPAGGDYLTLLAPVRAGETPPQAAYDAKQGVLTVRHGGREEQLFLAPAARDATLGGTRFHGRVALLREGKVTVLDGQPA